MTTLTKMDPATKATKVATMPSQRSGAVFSSTVCLKDEAGRRAKAHSTLRRYCWCKGVSPKASSCAQPFSVLPHRNKEAETWQAASHKPEGSKQVEAQDEKSK